MSQKFESDFDKTYRKFRGIAITWFVILGLLTVSVVGVVIWAIIQLVSKFVS